LKEVYIERRDKLLRIAIREKGKLKECYIEEEDNTPKVGEIYRGVVKNIVPAIKCAFVDIGYHKNCYMNLQVKENKSSLKKGDEVLVEVLKEEIDKKGPKISDKISLPGTYVVLTNSHTDIEISSKIKDEEAKSYLKKNLVKPEDIGIVVRTKAENIDISLVNKEICNLNHTYLEILRKFKYSNKLGVIYSDEGILSRILRNSIDGDDTKLFFNSEEDYKYCKTYIENNKMNNCSLELHKGELTLFHFYNIESEILSLRNSKVNLLSGGNIVIEKTEAMYVIDVNSSKNTKSTNFKDTVLNTNIEAAKEIAHQIRLRNLGGIILVDFIDMRDGIHKNKVLSSLKKGFKDDKSNPMIYPFTELNLIQISRKRYGKSIYDYILEPCDTCKGKGERVKLSYLANIIKSKVIRIKEEQGVQDIFIELDSNYEKEIKSNIINFIISIESLDRNIYISFTPHFEGIKVEPLLFANQIRNLEGLKVFDFKEFSTA
jgi:ribonuclease G